MDLGRSRRLDLGYFDNYFFPNNQISKTDCMQALTTFKHCPYHCPVFQTSNFCIKART